MRQVSTLFALIAISATACDSLFTSPPDDADVFDAPVPGLTGAARPAAEVSLYAVDFDASVLGVRVSGERGLGRVKVPPSLAATQHHVRGSTSTCFGTWDMAGSPLMPRSHFSVGLRLDAIDFDRDIPGDDTRQLTLGVNFRPKAERVFKLNYVRGRTTDRFNFSRPVCQPALLGGAGLSGDGLLTASVLAERVDRIDDARPPRGEV